MKRAIFTFILVFAFIQWNDAKITNLYNSFDKNEIVITTNIDFQDVYLELNYVDPCISYAAAGAQAIHDQCGGSDEDYVADFIWLYDICTEGGALDPVIIC